MFSDLREGTQLEAYKRQLVIQTTRVDVLTNYELQLSEEYFDPFLPKERL